MDEELHPATRKPSAGLTVVRIVLITILTTLLCFAVALFFGIVGFLTANFANGGGFDMSLAYRKVAFPLASAAMAIIFVATLIYELRRYRRLRTEYVQWKRVA